MMMDVRSMEETLYNLPVIRVDARKERGWW